MIFYKDDAIIIRDLEEKDVVSLFSWWIDEEINKYDPRPLPQNSKQLIEECTRYCRVFDKDKMNSDVKARKYIYFMITDIENRPIGAVNFFGIDYEKKQGEMGVIIGDKRYWGKGIATKAVKIAVDYIFSNMYIDRVYIETGEANIPALGLFRKLGFTLCGEYIEDDGFKFVVMDIRI